MPRFYVKMRTDTLDDVNVYRLSERANHTFLALPILAGKCDHDGALDERTGPLRIDEISRLTKIPVRAQRAALDELIKAGFAERSEGAYVLLNFERHNSLDNYEASAKYRKKVKGPFDSELHVSELVAEWLTNGTLLLNGSVPRVVRREVRLQNCYADVVATGDFGHAVIEVKNRRIGQNDVGQVRNYARLYKDEIGSEPLVILVGPSVIKGLDATGVAVYSVDPNATEPIVCLTSCEHVALTAIKREAAVKEAIYNIAIPKEKDSNNTAGINPELDRYAAAIVAHSKMKADSVLAKLRAIREEFDFARFTIGLRYCLANQKYSLAYLRTAVRDAKVPA